MITLQEHEPALIYFEEDLLYAVYDGPTEVWSASALSGSDFLRYYNANMWVSFQGSFANQLAPFDSGYVLDLDMDFIGDDEGTDIYEDDINEYTSYGFEKPIAEYFRSDPILGVFDELRTWDVNDECPDHTPDGDPAALWDYTQVWELGTKFYGNDSGTNIHVYRHDESLHYVDNFSTYFLPIFPLGEYDQMWDADFLDYKPVVNGAWDQTLVHDLLGEFTGIDTGTDLWTHSYDEMMMYQGNFSTNFFNEIILGVFDGELGYTFGNDFLSYAPIVDEPGSYDSGHVKILGEDFLGPDSGEEEFDHRVEAVVNYLSTNIATEFKNPPDPGVFDFDLVYSFSNMDIKFYD